MQQLQRPHSLSLAARGSGSTRRAGSTGAEGGDQDSSSLLGAAPCGLSGGGVQLCADQGAPAPELQATAVFLEDLGRPRLSSRCCGGHGGDIEQEGSLVSRPRPRAPFGCFETRHLKALKLNLCRWRTWSLTPRQLEGCRKEWLPGPRLGSLPGYPPL